MAKKTPASVAERLPVPVELIERRIYLIRGQKVMLDSDLPELYQVETRALMEEAAALRSQTVILEKGRGRYSLLQVRSFSLHRARRGHAIGGSQQRARCPDERSDSPRIRENARTPG